MYSVVLMAALTTGATEPGFGWKCGCRGSACAGYNGCGGYAGCHGGYGGCHGCQGGWYYGCWGGCHSYSCWGYMGCYGCFGPNFISPYNPVIVPPAAPKPEKIPAPKDDKKEPEKKEPDKQARLIIEVPADAKLFIDDQPMKTLAARRVFRTPQLDKGQTYFYDLRAEVTRDGKTQTMTKRVILRAGDEVRASFNDLATEATASK